MVVAAASMALTHKPVNVLYPGVARGLCGCGHVMLAKSDDGLKAALFEHGAYVIAVGDPSVCNEAPIKLWRS